MTYLYVICSPDGKLYFGVTCNPKDRWASHRKSKNRHPLYDAMRELGRDNFTFTVLAEYATRAEAFEAEAQAIASIGTTSREKGFNVSSGGEWAGSSGGEALRQKLAEDPSFYKAYSLRSKKSVSKVWAGRSDIEKREIFDKISNSLKSRCEEDEDFAKAQRERMLAARAKGDVKERAAAASKGIKQWWVDLRADPERYAEYIARRKATLQETNRKKKECLNP